MAELSSQSRKWKLLGLILVVVVVVGVFGYWTFAPRMPTGPPTSTTQYSSSVELSTTASTPESTTWVNVDVTKPVNYYFTLLESSKTQDKM